MGRPNSFDLMMYEFCVRLGWCGCVRDGKPLHVTDFIPESGSVSANELVRWLILADGADPDRVNSEFRHWIPQLKAVFVEHMGAEVVDATNLRSQENVKGRRRNAFDVMMYEFCVRLGWCGGVKDGKPLHITHYIPETGPVSADEFARWLILAEFGHWIPRLKAVFVEHMGAEVIDATNLRSEWECKGSPQQP
jgi:hypothetical protein